MAREYSKTVLFMVRVITVGFEAITSNKSIWNASVEPGRDQLEYTAPTGFRFLDEPMFCFSTLNANMNPNPNCRPGHRPWPLTPWRSLPGHRPWPLTRFIVVSSQGGAQAGFATVLAARVGAQADS